MVSKPKAKVAISQISTNLSRQVALAAKRSDFKRRLSKISKPAMAIRPNTPPNTMAIICLALWLMPMASQNHTGVSRPNRWPKNTIKMPT